MIIVLIGPMGCGKTTVGQLLAARLGYFFDDADDFHPAANKEKMRAGVPLDDDDRAGWLAVLRQRIEERLAAGGNLVLACSALKQKYRDQLGIDQRRVVSVYLQGTPELLGERIDRRDHQYMNKGLLASQIQTMEEPQGGLVVPIDGRPDELVTQIIRGLSPLQGKIMESKADIGLAGLAVMGENLVLNMASKGFSVAVYNRTISRVDAFLAGRAKGKTIAGYHSVADFVAAVARPRRIMMMLQAGAAVDQFIEQLLPYLEPGDVVIDGGNSQYQDSVRRTAYLAGKGLLFVGTGVSGGEEGALHGPSIMPGGAAAAWPLVEPVFTAIAARAGNDEPCCAWMGNDGAGHFVKMVHNGIEYGDMQLIGESYQIMRQLGLTAEQLQQVFARWNEGELSSYLIEITADIFKHRQEDGQPTVDLILDAAGQKGTGKWTVVAALEQGVPLSLISESVFARCLSAAKELRQQAAMLLPGPAAALSPDGKQLVAQLEGALLTAKIISYAQGYALLQAAAAAHGWQLDFAAIARIWRGGCIIRSVFLDRIAQAFQQQPELPNLLFATYFRERASHGQADLRAVVAHAVTHGLAVPCLSAALAYYDSLRCQRLPANLLQAQRDYFGAHTYERVDRPQGEFFHTNWTGKGGDTTASTYSR